jgi:hypothetical protein
MRIVIETSQEDDRPGTPRAAETEVGTMVLDGGPAPAALLRRLGRIPEAKAEEAGTGTTAAPEAGAAGVTAPEIEGEEAPLNPLRYGAAVASQRDRSGGRARVENEVANNGEDVALHKDPKVR